MARGIERLRSTIRSNVEYYPFTREVEVLEREAQSISQHIPENALVVEIGTGQQAKSMILLCELLRQQKHVSYCCVDSNAADLKLDFTGMHEYLHGKGLPGAISCQGFIASLLDFASWLTGLPADDKRPVTFLIMGSTVALNREEDEAASLLSHLVRASQATGRTCNILFSVNGCRDKDKVQSLLFDEGTVEMRHALVLNALNAANAALGYRAFAVSAPAGSVNKWEGGGLWDAADATVRQFARCLILPPEIISDILSLVAPSWCWGRLGWDSDRGRGIVADHVRKSIKFIGTDIDPSVLGTFDDLVIDLVLAKLRAGKLHRDLPLRRGAPRSSTIAFVERLLRALVTRTAAAPLISHDNGSSLVRTIVEGAALSADFFTSGESEPRQIGSDTVAEEANGLRDLYTEALISTLTIIIGPSVVLDILQPGQVHGADMFGPVYEDKQQWHIAALMGAAFLGRIHDLKRIPSLVGNGDNAVHFAALAGHTEAVEWLIDKGVDCDLMNNDGLTPLYLAASAGHAGVVGALFTAKPGGLRTEIKDSIDRAPIHYAVERGYADVVQEFLSRENTDMEIQDGLGNPVLGRVITPLVLAAVTGRDAFFHAILARCGMPDPETVPRRTMCRVVIRGGNLAITKTVMEIEMRSGENRNWLLAGETLCYAADWASDDVFGYLLSFGDAEIHYVPWGSEEPLEPTVLRAAIRSNKLGHVRAILGHPRFDAVRIFAPDTPRRSPLPYLTQPDGLDPAIMAALLAHPAFDANVADMSGRTPLHDAASTGQVKLVNLLLAHPGIEIAPVDSQGKTPVCEAAERGHAVVVRALLDKAGSAVWDATPFYKSPLAFAVSAGKVKIVRVLLEPKYRVPRDLVHLEMGEAERILAENMAHLADWRRGV
ncbi:hypothetical protein BJY01DRAFT_249959 [Aspergillus pseudoustus]|uniref:Histidine-specific methyltransferase SAM-dependent domain-containing protein n=1 Tax=Aspergillus pseudoustus TaxID=1810923 RepID=A0ABR4JKG4_9EURO